jgi:hypothetical protein
LWFKTKHPGTRPFLSDFTEGEAGVFYNERLDMKLRLRWKCERVILEYLIHEERRLSREF